MKEKTYIAIDLKSFYASVECVERGLDPLSTNLVVADSSKTEKTICLAVTPSLKAYGISGRARLFEVVQQVNRVNAERRRKQKGKELKESSFNDNELKSNPSLAVDYIAAPPRMALYRAYSTKIFYDEFYVHLYVNEKRQLVTKKTDGCVEIHMLNVREDGSYIQPRVMQHCGRVVHYELGYKKFDYHSLRHTHATMLIENGAPIKDVQHRLGHKSVQVTLDIYSHVTQKMQIQTVDILNSTSIDGSVNESAENAERSTYLNACIEPQETRNRRLRMP